MLKGYKVIDCCDSSNRFQIARKLRVHEMNDIGALHVRMEENRGEK